MDTDIFGAKSGSPNLPALLTTAYEVAAAMKYLHTHNILHGDLTSGNVLLSSQRVLSDDLRGFCAKVRPQTSLNNSPFHSCVVSTQGLQMLVLSKKEEENGQEIVARYCALRQTVLWSFGLLEVSPVHVPCLSKNVLGIELKKQGVPDLECWNDMPLWQIEVLTLFQMVFLQLCSSASRIVVTIFPAQPMTLKYSCRWQTLA